jgi:hypothetical protein
MLLGVAASCQSGNRCLDLGNPRTHLSVPSSVSSSNSPDDVVGSYLVPVETPTHFYVRLLGTQDPERTATAQETTEALQSRQPIPQLGRRWYFNPKPHGPFSPTHIKRVLFRGLGQLLASYYLHLVHRLLAPKNTYSVQHHQRNMSALHLHVYKCFKSKAGVHNHGDTRQPNHSISAGTGESPNHKVPHIQRSGCT